MNISVKLRVLHQVNTIYDDFIRKYDLACDRLCAHCCTRNVTMTTLEGYQIIKYLTSSNQMALLEKIKSDEGKSRFIPAVTTNALAQMGYDGEDIPDEDAGDAVENCPILKNDECPVYEVRPFGCRCLVSKYNCQEKGYAEIDPFVVTVNNVFLQFIEHMDEKGFFGNFTDVLLFLESEDMRQSYETASMPTPGPGLIKNHPLSVLLVPPEHRERIKPILELLQILGDNETKNISGSGIEDSRVLSSPGV